MSPPFVSTVIMDSAKPPQVGLQAAAPPLPASANHKHGPEGQAVSNGANKRRLTSWYEWLKGMWPQAAHYSVGRKFVDRLLQENSLTSTLMEGLTLIEYARGNIPLVDGLIEKVCSSSEGSAMQLSSIKNTAVLGGKDVVFLCFAADGYLVLIIIKPHNSVKRLENMTHDGTLNVIINRDSKKPECSFSVYSVPCETDLDSVARFVVDALFTPQLKEISKLSLRELMKSRHFCANQCIKVLRGKSIYVASTSEDFSSVSDRFVNYVHDEGLSSATLIDHRDDSTRDENPNVVNLIGGELGIGKTLEMLTNFSYETDLTVYVMFERDISSELPRARRDNDFKKLAVQLVQEAINATCPGLNGKLKAYKEAPLFRVRICFDEMGDKPCATHACCAVDPREIRDALGWSKEHVEVRVFAAGTGIWAAKNHSGSENHRFRLSILRAPRGSDLYWKFRIQLLHDPTLTPKWKAATTTSQTTACLDRLKTRVMMVRDCWSKPFQERADAIRDRNNALRECFELAEPNEALITQSLFSAVESDYACTQALENPRVAACIVAQCQKVATTTLVGQVARGVSGYNVRREVLQPVTEKIRSLSGLSDTSGEEACRLLVQSFRKEEFIGSE